jgi:hypothetical protein
MFEGPAEIRPRGYLAPLSAIGIGRPWCFTTFVESADFAGAQFQSRRMVAADGHDAEYGMTLVCVVCIGFGADNRPKAFGSGPIVAESQQIFADVLFAASKTNVII